MATATNPATTAEDSPFDDPAPAVSVPTSNSETNPFRVRHASGGSNGPPTPVLAAFPAGPTNVSPPGVTSPAPKSKNPFIDLAAEDDPSAAPMPPKATEPKPDVSGVKEPKEPSQRRRMPSPNGNHRPHPRLPKKPDDPKAPRSSSPHRRREPTSDRDRDRYRDRRDRPPPPDGSRRPRPRSNSESSVPNERAHRRREDGHVHKTRSRREKDDPKKDDRKSTHVGGKRRLHPVDKIDLLDVTGSHGFFHHDGPFDACRPHRNKHAHKAPVAAFPANSLTNTLAGGLGEVPGLDRDKYFGLRPQEAFQDYGHVAPVKPRRTSDPERSAVSSRKEEPEEFKVRPSVGVPSSAFDPRLKTEPVHGIETQGLGTSTFLEGAPAPRSAIERQLAAKEEEEETAGLQRKKSLVQKIKGRRIGDRSPPLPLTGPLLSPTSTHGLDQTYNPFLKESHFVEKVESAQSNGTRERADSGGSDRGNGPNSLLGRVKSLKIAAPKKGRKAEE